MRKYYLGFTFFIVCFCSAFICRAQQNKSDSLINVIRTGKDDSMKVFAMNLYFKVLSAGARFDSAHSIGNRMVQLSTRINFKKGVGMGYYCIGQSSIRLGNYFDGAKNLNTALTIYKEVGYNSGIAAVYGNLGGVYWFLGNYSESVKYDLLYLGEAQVLGSKRDMARAFNNLGLVYWKQGDTVSALKNYNLELAIGDSLKDRSVQGPALSNIGLIYEDAKKFEPALKCYSTVLRYDSLSGEAVFLSNDYNNIADIKVKQDKYDDALLNYFIALKYAKLAEQKDQEAMISNNIGEIMQYRKQYDAAEKYWDTALKISLETQDRDMLKDCYGHLSTLDTIQKDYKKAFWDNMLYYKYKDSLVNEEQTQKTVKSQMSFDFSMQQAAEKKEQEKKDSKQRLVRDIFIGGFSFAFLFAVVFFFQRKRISKEKRRSDELLLNILPSEVAEELKNKGNADAKQFDEVTVMFTDFKSFTTIAEKLSAKELVAEIDYCFKGFDNIIHKYNIEKIKTIGDSYMAASGLPVVNKTHAKDMVSAALEIVQFMEAHKQQRIKEGKPVFEIRIGINSGHVIAGIVGLKKFAYDIWGDTVNLASRMESSGEPGKVNISGSTYELVKNDFICTYRGKIQAKNKGEVDMYFVN